MKPRSALAGVLAAAMLAGTLAAQDKPAWDVTQPSGKTRDIAFTTTEGTWMSIDLSPDSQWLVFDLLGHSYRIPAGGGQAVTLTQVGKLADFMVLNSDPLVNIRNTADIMYVVKGGVVYDDENLNEVWPRQRTFGTGRWVIPDALKQDDKPIRP